MKFCGIVLEGITGSGKSTLYQRLGRSPRVLSYESRLFLAQAYTLRMGREAEEREALHRLVDAVECLHTPYQRSEFSARSDARGSLCWVMEGFQYYMALDRLGPAEDAALVESVETRLCQLGGHLVVLTVEPDAILEQCVLSTLRHRGAGWRDFLFRTGGTEEEVAEVLRQRQERLLALVAVTRLPVVRLDTTSQDWDAVTARVEECLAPSTPRAAGARTEARAEPAS
jgi:hypothetical protein